MNPIEALSRDTAANLVLAVLALLVAAIGVAAWWIAAHPKKVRSLVSRLGVRPRILRYRRRFHSQVEFLVRRFQPEGAFGLSFTVGLAVLIASTWILGSVLEDVVGREEVALFDAPIVGLLAAHRIGWLTMSMRGITQLGGGLFVAFLVIAGGFILRRWSGSWRPMLLLAAAVTGSKAIELLIKFGIGRSRPPIEWMVIPASGWGFPSGHATQSTAVFGALAYIVAERLSDWDDKVRVWAVAVGGAFLVGVSRVYLGVHWPTDVIGGWALAGAWLAFLFTTTSTIESVYAASRANTSAPDIPAFGISAATARMRLPPAELVRAEGLTEREVKERVTRGDVNASVERASRTFGEILKANILTRFNALLGALCIIMLWVGPPQDALFGIVLVVNSTIGIFEEFRAKRTLDRLVLLAPSTVRVVRAGASQEVPTGEIVRDDLVELRPGNQVPVDGIVLSSNGLEIDESLLTGESEAAAKPIGGEVLSGSLVVAGTGRIQAVRVGAAAYARALGSETRKFALAHSELRDGINRILHYVTWLIVPAALVLIDSQLSGTHAAWRDALRVSVAGVVGIVPEGLILLTSIALAAAAVRLGQRRVLVQDLPAIELLARVDVICFDKTGTLTDGRIAFERLVPVSDASEPLAGRDLSSLRTVLGALAAAEPNPNASLAAINAECGSSSNGACSGAWRVAATVPFSSSRKWSAVTFDGRGTWVLGAPDVLLADRASSESTRLKAEAIAATGSRVLALCESHTPLVSTGEPILPADIVPVALVVLAEKTRSEVAATLRYFAGQGIGLKVISGDNPRTVAAVAASVGVPGSEIALGGSELPADPQSLGKTVESHTVFGRITPHQKRSMVAALRSRGHVVAMVGDGVNDALALKEADLGIAMGAGTSASRAVSQLVLLDNSFDALAPIIAEGRRVVANVERTANLFLTKTVYVLLMVLAVGVADVEFPFLPRHLTLIGALTIGIPAFFLALAPNAPRARSGFVQRVARFSIPAGCIVAGATLAAYALARELLPMDLQIARTAATLTLTLSGFSIIAYLIRTSAVLMGLLLAALTTALGAVIVLAPLRTFFALDFPPPHIWIVIGVVATATHLALGSLIRGSGSRKPGATQR
jgi:magnesium-transporting ATPase (P-type)/membrane-associated phospholipid phosphatase